MWQLGAQSGSKKKEGRDAMRWLVVRNGSIEGRVPVDPVDPIGGCLQGTKSRATHPQRIIRAWRYAYHRHHHHHCHRRHHRLHRHYYDKSNIYLCFMNLSSPLCACKRPDPAWRIYAEKKSTKPLYIFYTIIIGRKIWLDEKTKYRRWAHVFKKISKDL